MVRRPTLIVLGVFVVVLAVAVFLTKTPTGMGILQTETPTPTVLPKLLSGWPVEQSAKIDVHNSQGASFQLQRETGAGWAFVGQQRPVDPGKVERLLVSLAALETIDRLNPSTPLEAAGLQPPAFTLTLTSSAGDLKTIQIGNVSPTGNGRYLRVDQGDIVLVRKTSIDEVTGLLTIDQLISQPTETAIPVEELMPGAAGTPAP